MAHPSDRLDVRTCKGGQSVRLMTASTTGPEPRGLKFVFQDWHANRGNAFALLVLTLFRGAQLVRRKRITYLLLSPYLVFYRIAVEWMLGVELPWTVRAGPGLKLFHARGLVVNAGTVFGPGCTLRNTTTIGIKQRADGSWSDAPVIGRDVDIGVHVCILGPVTIGDCAVIGAGSVVLKDVPAGAVVAGNPARVIRRS